MAIPHPAIPIHTIHPKSILLLLTLGATYEIITRTVLFFTKKKRPHHYTLEDELLSLKHQTYQKRRLGPSAFVETSKLERAILSKEKELVTASQVLTEKLTSVEKSVKYASFVFYGSVFCLWYGVPLLRIDGAGVGGGGGVDDLANADRFMGGLIFPVSYMGLGMKVARVGLGELKSSSLGALVVAWAGQAVIDKLADCVECLLAL